MAHLSLSFLGPFQAKMGDRPAEFATDRARALLAYLAVEADRPHRREALAGLLWPDRPESISRQNLSQSLARLRRAIDDYHATPPFLRISGKTLQFNAAAAALDVTRFQTLFATCVAHPHADLTRCPSCVARLERAAARYRGEFLQGLFLTGGELFQEWALFKREQLHRQALDALQALTAHYAGQGAYDRAGRYAARQLALEPWRERAHRQLMRALALGGDRAAALAQYQTCRRVLANELGVQPAAETTALYERVRSGELAPPGPSRSAHQLLSSPSPNSQDWGAAPATRALYERPGDLAQLERWLVHDGCRLVVVRGMGGNSPTALTASVARALADQFDTVLWRSLLNAPPVDETLRSWLRILSDHRPADLPEDLEAQLALLLGHLRQRRCLLVLDNVESILQPGAGAGQRCPGYEGYGKLFQKLGETEHQSCLLLTGRELLVLHGHTDTVCALAFSPAGQILAGRRVDEQVHL